MPMSQKAAEENQWCDSHAAGFCGGPKLASSSTGSGKMMVEFFSAEI